MSGNVIKARAQDMLGMSQVKLLLKVEPIEGSGAAEASKAYSHFRRDTGCSREQAVERLPRHPELT
ncbi:hypothetical protein GCM10011504_45530 [Siccirubricoccus deserti]|nr:hypothetical protein GCM10011504_45530 [Siccirubricoccus deserti]